MKNRLKMLLSFLTSIAVVTVGTMSFAHAGVVDSATVMQMEHRSASIAQIESILERDTLADRMVAMGVDPADVITRLDQLTHEELLLLQERLEALPAGGSDLLAVIGLVFVVLLILELVGVTDIFKAI